MFTAALIIGFLCGATIMYLFARPTIEETEILRKHYEKHLTDQSQLPGKMRPRTSNAAPLSKRKTPVKRVAPDEEG